tara:strand:- start:19 stop:903 length:885 start_codon:yes stop_codon:yes gene_type:complete
MRFFIFICKILVLVLPISILLKLGSFLGYLAYSLVPRRRKIVLINLKLCFPNLTEKQRKKLAQQNFKNMGIGLFEALISWFKPIETLNKQKTSILGLDNLKGIKKSERGVMVLTGHLTSLDIMPFVLSKFEEFDFVYRPHEKKYLDNIIKNGRERFGHGVIPRFDMRQMFKALKNKKRVVYLLDQDLGLKHTAFVPFFNIPTATLTTMYSIAKKTNSALVPAVYYRKNNGEYVFKFYPEININKFKDLSESEIAFEVAKIYNNILEKTIREYPAQYLWAHRRFKTRPKGDKYPY